MKTSHLNTKFGFRIRGRRPNQFYAIVLERPELLPRPYFEVCVVKRLPIRWTNSEGWLAAINKKT